MEDVSDPSDKSEFRYIRRQLNREKSETDA